MKKYFIIILLAIFTLGNGCQSDEEFMDKSPTDLLLTEQVWSSRVLVTNLLADLYVRLPRYQNMNDRDRFAEFNEAYISRNNGVNFVRNNDWGYGNWGTWNYGFIREVNLFIRNIQNAEPVITLDEADIARFTAEGRFIRALVYFDMVKRMGGVPLILEPLLYDFSGDPTYLQYPRATEKEVYDFVIRELEEVAEMLPDNPNDKTRATKGTALGMLSRVALYAGSIAKYGANTPLVQLSSGEVGIPTDQANAYYTKALAAAQSVTGYQLFLQDENDLSNNFANLFLTKGGNEEVMFTEDYLLKHKTTQYTVQAQPFSMTEESFGGQINPSLNIVAEFELLDNTFTPLPTRENGSYIYYDNATDLFANRDARLQGTVIVPGANFRSTPVQIWAGYKLGNGEVITSSNFQDFKTLPGKTTAEQVVGKDGPIPGKEYTAQTGFLIRKYLDPAKGAGSIGTGSDVWWIWLRYAEVLLNGAEAAFELDQPDVAAGFMNQVRRRAGFQIDLTPEEITFDRIVHERKVEFFFEDHLLWDMKRWRIAHQVWNGQQMSVDDLFANLGKATKPMTQIFTLMPYRTYTPENPVTDGKWVFDVVKLPEVSASDNFRLGNYYSSISEGIIAANPKIVRNPNH